MLSEGDNTRTVKFKVGDISQPVTMNMHIVVPEEVAGMEYDNQHTARLVLNTGGLPQAGGDEKASDDGTAEANNETAKPEENPPTGDHSSILFYVMLLVGSAGAIFVLRKLRPTRN